MKKYVNKIVLVSFIIILYALAFGRVDAAVLNIDYNTSASTSKSSKCKVYPGDEIYISFKVDDSITDKVMAIYGSLQYDKNVLEIDSPENNTSDNPKMGDGWLAGSINKTDNTFFFYTLDDNRSDTVGYMKFRVNSGLEGPVETVVSTKNITLYKKSNQSNYEEIKSEKEDVNVTIKIRDKSAETSKIIFVTTMAIVIAGMGIFVIIKIIKSKSCIKEANKENDSIGTSKTEEKKVKGEEKESSEKKKDNKEGNKKVKESNKEQKSDKEGKTNKKENIKDNAQKDEDKNN